MLNSKVPTDHSQGPEFLRLCKQKRIAEKWCAFCAQALHLARMCSRKTTFENFAKTTVGFLVWSIDKFEITAIIFNPVVQRVNHHQWFLSIVFMNNYTSFNQYRYCLIAVLSQVIFRLVTFYPVMLSSGLSHHSVSVISFN